MTTEDNLMIREEVIMFLPEAKMQLLEEATLDQRSQHLCKQLWQLEVIRTVRSQDNPSQ